MSLRRNIPLGIGLSRFAVTVVQSCHPPVDGKSYSDKITYSLELAAIVTLFSGLFLLILRLGSEIATNEGIIKSGFLYDFASVNFSYMAIWMFIFSVALCISTSLLTSEPDYKKIQGLSYGTLTSSDRISSEKSYTTIDVVLSIVLVLIVIGILLFFSPIFF